MSRTLGRIGQLTARRPWFVIGGFVLVLLVLGGAAGAVGAGFTDHVRLGDTDSQRAADLLTQRFPAAAGDTATLVFHADRGLSERGEALQRVLTEVASHEDIQMLTPLQTSADGATAYTTVLYTKRAADLGAEHLHRLEASVAPLQTAGVEASMRGPVVDRWRVRPVPVGEVVGLVAALVLVSLLFRSVIATIVTIGGALLGLALGNTVLAVASGFIDIPTVAPTIAVMLGLGAGVDYALFLVARFRARLRAGDDVATAVARANSTTGTAVVTAGAIVVVSICGLAVTGITVIGRMGLAAAIVVTVAAITAVTLVPAALRLAGRRVLPRSERGMPSAPLPDAGQEGRRVRALAARVARRPWLSAVGSAAILLAVAAPALNLQLGQPDDGNRPVGDTMRIAYDRLAEGFGPGVNGPLLLAVDLQQAANPKATLQQFADQVAAHPSVASVAPAQLNAAADTAVLTVLPKTAPQSHETSDLVQTLRQRTIPNALLGTGATAYVGGQTATFDDLATKVGDSLVPLILVVVLVSVLLLTLAFRSFVLPLVSAALNLLSIGAAYGVVTLAFQSELGTRILGVAEQPVVSFVPMLMFAIIFGLSMDYNVFLLSAVREERLGGHSARAAVPLGVGRTAALMTSAGAIMTLVFLGFTFTSEVEVRMIGLGLATAVFIDVTIVRLFLAPAVLELLGEAAWWLPRWLERRLPQARLEH
jgi:RND superfamily putative drug exporter